MGRTKGAQNKQIIPPEIVGVQDSERLVILADVLLEIVLEESRDATTNN
jgi:hypothetical protein